jgi:hypothetical protein
MKRAISFFLSAAIILSSVPSAAQRGGSGFEGGIRRNERDSAKLKSYREVVYVTGKPVELSGTIETRLAARSIRYVYTLKNEEKEVSLSRNVTVDRKLSPSNDNTQVVEVNNLASYKEEIKAPEGTYKLEEYQFYNSTVDDNQPVVTHYQGSWNGKKRFSVNGDEGEISVATTGNIYGFEQFWGATEKQVARHEIEFTPKTEGGEKSSWSGTADTETYINKTVRDSYIPHANTVSSFDGIYTLSESEESFVKYEYDLPYTEDSEKDFRNIGSGEMSLKTTPTQEQLYIPRYRDIKSHWGEMYIKKLAGLQAENISKEYFLPDRYITREEFAVWLSKALKLEKEEFGSTRSQVSSSEPRFNDISSRHPNYSYIQNIRNRKIMNGVGENKFEPDSFLTREAAATIVSRALGIERIAPNLPFRTHFRDDDRISIWAKKSVYSVNQVGIMHGYAGSFSPGGTLTRAEASALIERIIDYIRVDLKREYGI